MEAHYLEEVVVIQQGLTQDKVRSQGEEEAYWGCIVQVVAHKKLVELRHLAVLVVKQIVVGSRVASIRYGKVVLFNCDNDLFQ